MIERFLQHEVEKRLTQFPAVALLGPRQVGKTTLAYAVAAGRSSVYLDLEAIGDREKLRDAELYLEAHADKLVILDEVQRVPKLFEALRGIIDRRRRAGFKTGQFLLLGSASIELLRQSGESLAGRIAYLELPSLQLAEVGPGQADTLWVRGGFPDSFLVEDDSLSLNWRENFIRTYLERDIPQLGPRLPAESLRRFWTMLAHHQGGLLKTSALARGLAVDGRTINRYLDLLVDLLLVRRLPPWHQSVGKRLVKSPKVLIRDSGIVHALLGLPDREQLLGHPVVGASWEAFVIETLIAAAPDRATAWFYRTAVGAEIDLILEMPGGGLWAIEIKRSLVPKLERGFYHACADLRPVRKWLVYAGEERYPMRDDVEALSLTEMSEVLRTEK